MGLGRSGQAAARLASRHGARVLGVDLRPDVPPIDGVDVELGPHRAQAFEEADLIVVSPGIPPGVPLLRDAVAKGTPVVGELAFADSFLEAPTIAVTGTNGKSTVTWFVHQLLEHAGMPGFVGGNLGNPLSNAALAELPPARVVVEVSSYQLELPGSFCPNVGVILNLTPDHLARHGTMEAYGAAKGRLFERMGGEQWAILPHGDGLLETVGNRHGGQRAWLGAHPGVIRTRELVDIRVGDTHTQLSLAGFKVPGAHNLGNAACAALCAILLGANPDAVESGFARLRPLPHRMEVVAEREGVRWINDSKATNIEAALAGISGLKGPAVILLGGEGKVEADGSLGMVRLATALQRHRAVVAFGKSGPRIVQELNEVGLSAVGVGSLAQAVKRAASLARTGDTILLSPGCASFDAFDDFEHRGRTFSRLAKEGA